MVNTKTGGTPGKFMTTHGDVIVGISTDEDGTVRYHMMGGNKGDTLFSQDMTAEEMTKKYLGHLSRQDRPAETESRTDGVQNLLDELMALGGANTTE